MTALALAISLALLAPPDGGAGDAGVPPGTRRAGPPDRGGPDGGAPDPDAEVIEQLDLLERLELLDQLDLFDSQAPPGSDDPSRARR